MNLTLPLNKVNECRLSGPVRDLDQLVIAHWDCVVSSSVVFL